LYNLVYPTGHPPGRENLPKQIWGGKGRDFPPTVAISREEFS